MALLSDLTREQNRTKAMAFIGVSFGITFAIAMVTGPLITHALGLSGLFWLIALLALAAIAMVLWVVPTPAATCKIASPPWCEAAFVPCSPTLACSSSTSASSASTPC
jgi:MFS family permease